jgi:hypothetical protein
MRTRTILNVCAILALSASACKKEPTVTTPPGEGETPQADRPDAVAAPSEPSPVVAPAAASPSAGEPVRTPLAQDVLKPGVRFQFALRDSPDVLKNTTETCAAKARGDAEKQAACIGAIEREGATEGIRFEKEGDRLVWVSYGEKAGGNEDIFLRGPVELLPSGPSEFKMRPVGAFTGQQAKGMGIDTLDAARASRTVMTVQVLDSNTVAMPAPAPKGLLVYHRKS